MVNLKTEFMGLELSGPVIAGSSGLTGNPDKIKELAENGAGAVVLKSLFEEQILAKTASEIKKGGIFDGNFVDEGSFEDYIAYYEKKSSISDYINLIKTAKSMVLIPVVASINAVSSLEWQSFCSELAGAGADAIQLNLFVSPFDTGIGASEIEEAYVSIVKKVKASVDIPLAVKIGSSFTNPGNIVLALEKAGADSVVMFNRYFSVDFNIDTFKTEAAGAAGCESDYLPALRWISLLSGKTSISLVGASGIYTAGTVIKFLLAGAGAVELVSAFYKNGTSASSDINNGISKWMDSNKFSSIADFKGRMSAEKLSDRFALERVQFIKQFGEING